MQIILSVLFAILLLFVFINLYKKNRICKIQEKQIQKELLTPSEDGLLYGAMIIFVLMKVYDGYFDKSEDNK